MNDKKSLLIVDDDIAHRTMLRILLDWEYDIIEADDGFTALDKVREHSFDLVLMDVRMIKLSGLEIDRDIQIKFTGLRPGEKLYEELLNDGENTLPTHHPQIMIGKVREYEFDNINRDVNELIAMFDEQDNEAIVRKMKAIVPEFISKNSVYEKLDQE